MPRQLRKLQTFPEMTRHFRKCVISAIACDIYRQIFCIKGLVAPVGNPINKI